MGASLSRLRRSIAYWVRRGFAWRGRDRPHRMRRRRRAIDPAFAAEELLYMRWRNCHLTRGHLDISVIGFPDQSVNREKYSKPGDVLIAEPGNKASGKWIYYGVLSFSVDSVPRCLQEGDRVVCELSVEHDPVEHNYAHSEIRAYIAGKRVTKENRERIPKKVRKEYRLAIMNNMEIVSRPVI